MKRIICIASLLSILFSTQVTFAKYNESYLESHNGNTLRVPKPLTDAKLSQYFVIQSTNVQPGSTPVPPGSKLEAYLASHPMERQGLPSSAVNVSEKSGEPTLWLNQKSIQAYESVRIGLAKQKMTVVNGDHGHNRIEILDTFSTFDRINRDTPHYMIHLDPYKHATLIRIRTLENNKINENTSRRLLTTLSDGIRNAPQKKGVIGWLKSKSRKYKYE